LQKVPFDEEFFRIGHCLWALMLGFVGGVFARSVYQRRAEGPVRQAV
jgi:hypothetical protein